MKTTTTTNDNTHGWCSNPVEIFATKQAQLHEPLFISVPLPLSLRSLFLSFVPACGSERDGSRADWHSARLAAAKCVRTCICTRIPAHVTPATCVDVTHDAYIHVPGLDAARPRLDSTPAAGMRRDATRRDTTRHGTTRDETTCENPTVPLYEHRRQNLL